jgi:hypothetical protein
LALAREGVAAWTGVLAAGEVNLGAGAARARAWVDAGAGVEATDGADCLGASPDDCVDPAETLPDDVFDPVLTIAPGTASGAGVLGAGFGAAGCGAGFAAVPPFAADAEAGPVATVTRRASTSVLPNRSSVDLAADGRALRVSNPPCRVRRCRARNGPPLMISPSGSLGKICLCGKSSTPEPESGPSSLGAL